MWMCREMAAAGRWRRSCCHENVPAQIFYVQIELHRLPLLIPLCKDCSSSDVLLASNDFWARDETTSLKFDAAAAAAVRATDVGGCI